MHTWFQHLASGSIGWKPSSFEYEVAIADLAIGVLGILAFLRHADFGFRLATAIAASIWLGGDAINHVRLMIAESNFTPGNAGPWFWTDVLVPVILLLCIHRMRKR